MGKHHHPYVKITIRVPISRARYLSELAAIFADEPLRDYVDDDAYFEIQAVERAQALAAALLDEIQGEPTGTDGQRYR